MPFPPVPPVIKSIAHVLKIADEHDTRNVVVSYWARMYACQTAMKVIPGSKPPEVSALLSALILWLEETKSANPDIEGITNETVAQALIEEYAMQLFTYADGQDRAENFNKNMIKAFYTSGILMDVLEQFGDTAEFSEKKKYAKWKAAYIHNCLKTGDTPTAGGPDEHLQNVIDTNQDNDPDQDIHLMPKVRPPFFDADNGARALAPAPSPVTPSVPKPLDPPTAPPVSSTIRADDGPDPELIQKAQKFCKFATSALNYDDTKAAIENLTKALNLLTTENDADNK